MSELTDCLQTLAPLVFDFPDDITHPSDPVPWALEMFAASLFEADMQAREGPSGKDEPTHVPRTLPRARVISTSPALCQYLNIWDQRNI